MLVVLLLIILLIFASCIRGSVLDELNFISYFLHSKCMNLLPESIESKNTLAALVCGHNFEQKSASTLYVATGLIHLFVVSGSHLSLIFNFIKSSFHNKISIELLFLLLAIYAAVCQFNPPVTRSLITLAALYFLKSKHRHWGKDYVLFLCGLFCLILNPKWVGSLSLQMSWLAALCLELTSRYLRNHHHLVKHMPFYFIYYLTYLGLGLPQFAIVALALIVNPFLEVILFPLALIVYVVPFFGFIFDFCIHILNSSLSVLEFEPLQPELNVQSILPLNWILIFVLHGILYFKPVKS